MKIYIASSWRNQHAVEMLTAILRDKGHIVLSFIEQNYNSGYGASKGIPFEEWVNSESAIAAFNYDTESAMSADLIIYVGPSGKDAAAECGMAYAKGKTIFGLNAKSEDFGLMRKIISNWYERVQDLLNEIDFMGL